jgi:hypothetical protein
MKKCRICKQIKPLSEFYKMSQMRDGYRNECIPCFKAARRKRYYRNPQIAIRRVQEWRKKNPEKYLAYRRRYRELHGPRKQRNDRNSHLRRKYGISIEEFEFLVVAQAGKCAICGRKDDDQLHVDHDHKTGMVRGLLCGSCNRAMGLFYEDPNRFRSAELYLRRPQLMLGCGDKKTP